jgi:hypothetical protein
MTNEPKNTIANDPNAPVARGGLPEWQKPDFADHRPTTDPAIEHLGGLGGAATGSSTATAGCSGDQTSGSPGFEATSPVRERPRWWEPYTPVKQPVAWLAGVGGSLVLAAAGAGAAARWGTVEVGVRVTVLLCIHMIVVFLSERIRRSLPIAATSLAHLGATLAVPTSIAVTAFLGYSWRTCIAIGGLAGIAALEVQAKRWNARLLRGGEVVGVVLATAGTAAITHAPLGVLLGAAAVGTYAFGLRKRASATAAAAALTPALAVLATFNVGPGTIGELGARGSILAWAAPVASTLAAVVFGLEGKRRRSKAFLAAAIGSFVLGGCIAAWHDVVLRHVGFPLLIAGVLVAAEVVALLRERSLLEIDARSGCGKSGFNNSINNNNSNNNTDIQGEANLPRNANRTAFSDSSQDDQKKLTLLDFAELFSVALIAASTGSYWYAPVALVSVGFLIGALRRVRFLPFALPMGFAMVGAALTASHTVQNVSPDFDVFGLDAKLSAALWSSTLVLTSCAALRKSRALGFGVGAAIAGSILLQISTSTMHGTTQALTALVLGTVALGISMALDRKLNGADLAGIALIGMGALFVSWPWAPLLVVFAGAACVVLGKAKGQDPLPQIGGLLVLAGALGLLGDPRVPRDVVAGAVISVIAVVEWFEAYRGKNRLVPFAVSALTGGLWLVAQCLDDLSVTRLSTTLAIGVAAVALGVFRRLNLVALAGAAVCAATVLLASKDRLAALPTWVWAMTGGFVLLGTAVGVERRMKAKRA